MLGKLLPLGDIIASLLLILYLVNLFPVSAVKYAALYLVLKGGFFLLTCALKDFASFLDLLFGIYLFILYMGIYSSSLLTTITVLWLLQKGVLGML